MFLRLVVSVDLKRVVALFSVCHLSIVVHVLFHEFVVSLVLVCCVQ